jgi:hypothetical protein
MNRRHFTNLAWQSALAAALLENCAFFEKKNSRHLVETPENRMAYLDKMLKALCTDLGPHAVWTEAYQKAVEITNREMALACPVVELDKCTFLAWNPKGEAEFFIGPDRFECYASHGCPGTGEEGVLGVIRKTELGDPPKPFYTIADPASGKVLAYFDVSEYGRAVCLPYYFNPLWKRPETTADFHASRGEMPMFNIGRQDVQAVEAAMKKKTPVSYKMKAGFRKDASAQSVIGKIPGKSTDEIMLVGHLDTPYNSPGANDNTASALVIVMLAHAFSGKKPGKTLTFFLTAGEEYGKLGAITYKEKREKEGTLKNIKLCIELDSLTWGNNLQLYSSHRKFTEIISACNHDLQIHGAPKIFAKDSGGDCKPFREAGVPTVYVNSRGEDYEPKTLHLWHRPEDTPDGVHPELVENGFLVFRETLNRLV